MRRAVVTAVLCSALLLAGCGGDEEPTGSNAEPPRELTGVILTIDSEGLGEVNSFELKEGDESYRIFIDPDIDYAFNLGHLNEHLASGQPVHVELDRRGGRLYAQSIADA